jgi:hypothetical protein
MMSVSKRNTLHKKYVKGWRVYRKFCLYFREIELIVAPNVHACVTGWADVAKLSGYTAEPHVVAQYI